MGIDNDLNKAFAKAQIAAGNDLPLEGVAFISLKDDDKPTAATMSDNQLDDAIASDLDRLVENSCLEQILMAELFQKNPLLVLPRLIRFATLASFGVRNCYPGSTARHPPPCAS